MTLTQLRYFREVAETKSFTVAAKNLFVSQSSISIAIKDLEKELEFPLFIRKGKKTEISPYGQILYPHVCQSLSALDEGLLLVKQHNASNIVSIGCFVNTSHSLTPWFLKELNAPDIQVSLDVHQTYVDMFPDMIMGKYDLIITTNQKAVPSCDSVEIAQQAVFLMVPVAHKYAYRRNVRIEELQNDQLLFVAPNSYMDVHIKNMFAAYDLVPNIKYSPDYSTLALDVALGRGIALTTKLPVDNSMLVYIPVDDPLSKRAVYLSWPTNRKLSDAALYVRSHFLSTSKKHGPEKLIF